MECPPFHDATCESRPAGAGAMCVAASEFRTGTAVPCWCVRRVVGVSIACALLLVLTACGGGGSSNKTLDASFTRFDGSQASIGDYRGRPVVVNFFSSTCVPCQTEMPALGAGPPQGRRADRFPRTRRTGHRGERQGLRRVRRHDLRHGPRSGRIDLAEPRRDCAPHDRPGRRQRQDRVPAPRQARRRRTRQATAASTGSSRDRRAARSCVHDGDDCDRQPVWVRHAPRVPVVLRRDRGTRRRRSSGQRVESAARRRHGDGRLRRHIRRRRTGRQPGDPQCVRRGAVDLACHRRRARRSRRRAARGLSS